MPASPKNTIFRKIGGKQAGFSPQNCHFWIFWGEKLTEFPPKLIFPAISGENMKEFPPKNSNFREFGGKHRYLGTEFLCKKITPATTCGRP
jgi:hypothetical protein